MLLQRQMPLPVRCASLENHIMRMMSAMRSRSWNRASWRLDLSCSVVFRLSMKRTWSWPSTNPSCWSGDTMLQIVVRRPYWFKLKLLSNHYPCCQTVGSRQAIVGPVNSFTDSLKCSNSTRLVISADDSTEIVDDGDGQPVLVNMSPMRRVCWPIQSLINNIIDQKTAVCRQPCNVV